MLRVIRDMLHYLFERRIRCYPTGANAITLTGTTTTWQKGSYVEIVPANGITSNFRVKEIVVEAVSASIECELDIATGAAASESIFGTYRFVGTCRIPVSSETRLANTRISARIANKGTTARTADVSIQYVLENA
jgi:hypothetical protein